MRAVHSEVCGLSTLTTETIFVERYVTVNFFSRNIWIPFMPIGVEAEISGTANKTWMKKTKTICMYKNLKRDEFSHPLDELSHLLLIAVLEWNIFVFTSCVKYFTFQNYQSCAWWSSASGAARMFTLEIPSEWRVQVWLRKIHLRSSSPYPSQSTRYCRRTSSSPKVCRQDGCQ